MNYLFRFFPTPRSFLSSIIWLIFALGGMSWCTYFGMIASSPCLSGGGTRTGAASRADSQWTPYKTEDAVNITSEVPVSITNASIQEVFKDQRKRMRSFCASREIPTTVYREPTLRDLYHHILVDDKRKILFCYVPKVGCSNWKRVFLILAGLVDPSQKSRPSIDMFRQVNSLEKYTPKEQEYRLRNYFKFMFVRHPPERVLSAYRNKIEHPLITNPEEQSIWDEVRYSILNSYRIKFNNKIVLEKKRESEELYPTFPEFIHFLFDSDPALMNEHYKPMVELCQPCAIEYDYIGNFASLRQDADAILGHLGINASMFWDRGKHVNTPTSSHIEKYYRSLSPVDYRRLEGRFGDDIAFYNHLFPFADDGGYAALRSRT